MSRIPRLKICGLRRVEDALAVNKIRPHMAGFIFVPGRRRTISPELAEEVRKALHPSIMPVGVFVNADKETIREYLKIVRLGAVQLHGSETNEYIDELREMLTPECPVIIKAFKVEDENDIRMAGESHADMVLLDHGIGGTGNTFDWSLIRNIGRDFILAGGISSENVVRAIELTKPWGIDLSSSLETDGVKDPQKIFEFQETMDLYWEGAE